jgi:hypothetical protein
LENVRYNKKGRKMDIYAYQRPIGKIDDIPEIRNEFMTILDTKNKNEMARFGLLYGQHILNITGIEPCTEIIRAFEAVQKWIDGKANYHEARNISFRRLWKDAREEADMIKEKFYKTMAQISCIPHVKVHGLWATDTAITLINKMHPDNMGEVEKEREEQIELINKV